MPLLNQVIAKIAALLIAVGCPSRQSSLYALILIYLLTTGLLVLCLVLIIVRQRHREKKRFAPPLDQES